MTALRQEALSLVEQLPEEQMSNIIQYINTLRRYSVTADRKEDEKLTPKLKAFQELEKLLVPIEDLDYDKELAQARDQKYGYIG